MTTTTTPNDDDDDGDENEDEDDEGEGKSEDDVAKSAKHLRNPKVETPPPPFGGDRPPFACKSRETARASASEGMFRAPGPPRINADALGEAQGGETG